MTPSGVSTRVYQCQCTLLRGSDIGIFDETYSEGAAKQAHHFFLEQDGCQSKSLPTCPVTSTSLHVLLDEARLHVQYETTSFALVHHLVHHLLRINIPALVLRGVRPPAVTSMPRKARHPLGRQDGSRPHRCDGVSMELCQIFVVKPSSEMPPLTCPMRTLSPPPLPLDGNSGESRKPAACVRGSPPGAGTLS